MKKRVNTQLYSHLVIPTYLRLVKVKKPRILNDTQMYYLAMYGNT